MLRVVLGNKGLIPVYLILGIIVIGLSIFGGSRLAGGEGVATVDDGVYRYSVKVVCVPDLGRVNRALVPGRYRTAVNVLNSSREDANLMKALTLSVPMGQQPIIGDATGDLLSPRAGLDIDCRDLRDNWGLSGIKVPGGQGYVIIESDQQLTVTAVYTSLTKTTVGAGQSVDVEYIEGIWDTRSIFAPALFPDLIVTLDPNSSPRIECDNAGECSIHDVNFTIENIGVADAGPYRVRFEFSGGASTSFVENVGLLAGQSRNVGIGFAPATNCYLSETTAATCTVTATADSDGEVEESNEGNNVDVVAYWHEYEVVSGQLTWAAARDAAATLSRDGLQGHLAVISSQAENDLVAGLLSGPNAAWLGGFQPSGSAEPDGGWEWVNGEPFSYTNWGPGEPNDDFAAEDVIHIFGSASNIGDWNDFPRGTTVDGYVVEYE